MFKALAFSLIFVFFASASSGSEEDIVFGQKTFTDSAGVVSGPEVVYVSGTLTGKGIGYKNNSTFIACYSEQKECLTYSIQQIGEKLMSSLSPPSIYPIIKWNRVEIVASGDTFDHCTKVTISISRTTQDAVWVTEPINRYKKECARADATVYRWHIENPPFWKEAMDKTKK